MKLQVKDVMKAPPVTVSCELTVAEVSRLFGQKNISGAPVVDEKGNLLGVLSRTDLTNHWSRCHEQGDEARFANLLAEQVMTPFVFRVGPEDDLLGALEVMLGAGIHRMIVTRGEQPVGVVTSLDLLKALQSLLQARA